MKICSVYGCGKPVKCREWCVNHYMQWKRRGHPDPKPLRAARGTPSALIKAAVESNTDDCIIWPLAKIAFGYGVMNVNGKIKRCHNHVCRIVHGPPPKKMECAHSCGVRLCINPRHLSWKTREANQADRVLHGTSNRGTRQWNHRLTERKVLAIKKALLSGANQGDLGRKYGVGRKTINDINTEKTWAWL